MLRLNVLYINKQPTRLRIKGEIKGINKVLKNFEKFGSEGVKKFGDTTSANAQEIAAMAKVNAPSNLGKLKQSIHESKVTDLNYKILVGSDYGAYLEFGTGKKVRVPAELQKEAARFRKKSSGSFEQGLQSIRDWCKSKGIDVNAAYPIFISILKNGIAPQPYLYPAFVKGRKRYINDLKIELKKLTEKYG